jgi:hypothetical protein
MDRPTQREGKRDIGVAVATPDPLSMRRPSTLGFKKQDLPGNNERAGEDTTRGPGRHPNEIDEGAHNEGSVNDEAEASAVRCAYATSAASNENKAATSAVKAGAYNEGSNGDEAGASTVRRVYAASIVADDNKAAASTVRRARAWQIAPRCTAEADKIDKGTHNEGSLDNEAEASTARRAYTARTAAARGHSGPTHGRGRRHRQRGLRQGLRRQRGRGECREAWVCERCLRR